MATSTRPHPGRAATGALPLPDAWRVEVHRRPEREDPAGAHALAEIHELGAEAIGGLRLGRGFLLSAGLSRADVEAVVTDLLADPVLDVTRITEPGRAPAGSTADHRILVAPHEGVMDPVARTLETMIARRGFLAGGAPVRVGTYRAWEVTGSPAAEELARVARRVLANEVIETLSIDSEALPFDAHGDSGAAVDPAPREVPLLEVDDTELERISREGVLSLSLVEMREVQAHFRALEREPLLAELETVAQTWSEHCKHKTLTGIIEMNGERIDNLLKSTIFRATVELDKPWCVSVFHDNAGIVEFDGDWDVCFKVETHNHPSAIDPYGGAGTGIGGVIRDILGVGLGAKPIANTDAFFVGPLDLPEERLPKGCMHPRRILRGIVGGVRDYGNRMGIPTVSGGVWFDEGYVGNPLVYAGTVGLIPHGAVDKEVRAGDWIVAVGGRTGRDGIHGATFSSVELHEDSETVSSGAVQIGDPITEKTVLDCLLAARDQKLYRGVTDCGAGGFSSAVGEMGEKCGAEVELADVPLKYPGLAPHEIWISEAQERMVLSVPPEHLDELLELFAAEDVEAVAIGKFTDTGRLVVKYAGAVHVDLTMEFLHDGTPRPVRRAQWTPPADPEPGCPMPDDVAAAVLAVMGAPDTTSREWIVRQYDHEVQGRSVLKPFVGPGADGPGNGAVIQPLWDSKKGLAITCGANPAYGRLDPRAMALAAIDEALRNAVAVGADPERAALLDNFSWGNCDKPDRLGSIVLAAQACYDAAHAYSTPFISGKDSLNNEYRVGGESVSIPPTLLISAITPVPDVARSVSMDLKAPGNAIYLVGETLAELGGSSWLRHLELDGGRVPCPDLERAPRILRSLHAAMAAGHVRACHDLSEGGLAVAAGEMAFAGRLGLELELASVALPDSAVPELEVDAVKLFSESCTRFLVEVEPKASAAFEAALEDLPLARVGRVTEAGELVIHSTPGTELARIPLSALQTAHAGDFRG